MNKSLLPQSNLLRIIEQQRQLYKAMEPLAFKYSSMMDTLRLPSIELAQRLHEATRPYRDLQLKMLEGMKPIIEQQRRMQIAVEPLALKYSKMMDTLRLPSIELAIKLHESTLPYRDLQQNMFEGLRPILEQQRRLHEAMKPLGSALAQMPLESIKTNIEELQARYPDYVDVELQETIDETFFEINGESISANDIVTALESLSKQPSTETILEKIEALGSSNLRTIIVSGIISFLISLFFYVLSSTSPEAPRTNLHVLKKSAQVVELSLEQKRHLRFVYVKTALHVREDGYIHSEIVDILQPGTTIFLIEKNRKWSKISYVDPFTDETHTGWVFSRYLRKFD